MKAARVCAVFPLLPDPGAFLDSVRRAFPDAEIGFYTANREAAARAARLGVRPVVCRPLPEVFLRMPRESRRGGFDAVVVACEEQELYYYLMYLFQAAAWRGVRRFVDWDGAIVPFSARRSAVAAALARHFVPPLARTAVLHLAWLLMLPFALLLGLRHGRAARDARSLLAATRAMVFEPLPYLPIRPFQLAAGLRTAFRVMTDFARGPASSSPGRPPRLLLIRLDHIGDVLTSTAHLAALKAEDPPWRVTMVVAPWAAAAVAANPDIDELLVYPSEDPIVARGTPRSPASAERRAIQRRLAAETFDLVVDPVGCFDSTALFYLPRAARRATIHLNRWFGHGTANVVRGPAGESDRDQFSRILHAGGIDVTPSAPVLRVSDDDRSAADALLADLGLAGRPFLAIHPGAPWPGRRWPVERFGELAARARARYDAVAVGLFAEDEDLLRRDFLAATRGVGGVAVIGAPLPTIFGVLARASAFAGNDSGLMHAAAALGVPTLGVFGPGDFTRWRPVGPRAAAVSLELACSPCYQSYCTDRRCLSELDADRAWGALVRVWG